MLEWRFLHPYFLALLPLPLIWLAWHYFFRKNSTPSVVYSNIAPLVAGTKTLKTRVIKFLPILRALVLILGIVALARPQYGQVERRQASLGIDIAVALDISGSMDLDDFSPSRLEVAKDVVKQFVEGRVNDRMSVVVFGTQAYLLAPPSLDRQAVNMFVSNISKYLVPEKERNTAIGSGLALAVDTIKDSESESKVVILMTDGENTVWDIEPLTAARAAEALGVKVYTIGVGTNGVIQRASGVFGRMETVQVTLDEETLKEIAEITGGRYFNARDEDALRGVYEEIDRLEKTEIEVSKFDNYDERFMMLWMPAVALFMLEVLLRAFWLGRLP